MSKQVNWFLILKIGVVMLHNINVWRGNSIVDHSRGANGHRSMQLFKISFMCVREVCVQIPLENF